MSLEITEALIARQPPESQAIIRFLLARLAELEAKLGKTPENSSLPPSSRNPHAKPKPKPRRSKKKRGGQPRHKKHERALIATDAIDDLPRRGMYGGNRRLTRMCRELHGRRDGLWTFVEHAHVEPTNNGAERALRHAVSWRKFSSARKARPAAASSRPC